VLRPTTRQARRTLAVQALGDHHLRAKTPPAG
jgi:hypothetical protein